jgi:hypothetical protein
MTNETMTEVTMAAYLLRDVESGVEIEIQAADLRAAKEQAREWARDGYDAVEATIWVDVEVHATAIDDDGDECWTHESTVTQSIDPPAPACRRAGEEHDWQSPHALVGGLEENPGVHGHDGGVVITEACLRCGCRRRTDTWAQRHDTGQQGLTSISYDPGYYELPEVYDDDHVIAPSEVDEADAAGACDDAIEWLREGDRTVGELRAHNSDWYDWAVRNFGGLS